jgi:hypothetical protein
MEKLSRILSGQTGFKLLVIASCPGVYPLKRARRNSGDILARIIDIFEKNNLKDEVVTSIPFAFERPLNILEKSGSSGAVLIIPWT